MGNQGIGIFADGQLQRLKHDTKAIIYDFDGVWTDNREAIGCADGAIIKMRSHYDGQGISLLRDIGLRIAIATNEKDECAVAAKYLVEKWNNLPSTQERAVNRWAPVKLFTGVGHQAKAAVVMSWLAEIGVAPDRCAAMGDDVVDIPLLKLIDFVAAPITAEKVVRRMATFISERPAGYGAVRDFANYILEFRGIDQSKLRPY